MGVIEVVDSLAARRGRRTGPRVWPIRSWAICLVCLTAALVGPGLSTTSCSMLWADCGHYIWDKQHPATMVGPDGQVYYRIASAPDSAQGPPSLPALSPAWAATFLTDEIVIHGSRYTRTPPPCHGPHCHPPQPEFPPVTWVPPANWDESRGMGAGSATPLIELFLLPLSVVRPASDRLGPDPAAEILKPPC